MRICQSSRLCLLLFALLLLLVQRRTRFRYWRIGPKHFPIWTLTASSSSMPPKRCSWAQVAILSYKSSEYEHILRGIAQQSPARRYVGRAFCLVLSDTAVMVTGLDTVTGVRDGKPYSNNGRVTFVVAKRGSVWQIVHFHRSAMPT